MMPKSIIWIIIAAIALFFLYWDIIRHKIKRKRGEEAEA